ncbi:MAG: hypothetical protein U0L05_05005 [Schaedlerella sp.]|nr:hypothetical protein [Schaedlerella sp.]
MKLTKAERETIILFNEEDEYAEIYTYNTKLKQKLRKLAKEHPEACSFEWKNEWNAHKYKIQKNLVTVRVPYSEERKQKGRERALAEGLLPPLNVKTGANAQEK